ncbi:MAG: hypothetical protein KDC90_06945 [Ignavibacteriae bacterium]|nr:hypothetical protein [Ignavibacteriota bacterium]
MVKSKLKYVILPIVFLLLSSLTYAQIRKLRTTGVAVKYKLSDYRWGDWSDFEETSILIVMDLDKDRITIYSDETQIYDVAQDEGRTTDSDGDDFWSFYCINSEGLACRVRLAKLNSQNGRYQLYIDFSDMKWVYNLYSLD